MKVLFAVLFVLSLAVAFMFYCCCCAASRADRWMEERDRLREMEEENENIKSE